MRTTLNLDDDVLAAAKELAAAQKKTAGKVISELARAGLCRRVDEIPAVRNGFELLPAGGHIVTADQIDKMLEEEL